MKNEMLTRSQADGRIRGAARVASGFCWVAALVALLSALFGAWSTVVLTTASMEETGHDAVTAFFATSKGGQGFLVSETGEQPPQITYDEDGNEVGRSQVMGSTVYLAGSPVSTFANALRNSSKRLPFSSLAVNAAPRLFATFSFCSAKVSNFFFTLLNKSITFTAFFCTANVWKPICKALMSAANVVGPARSTLYSR